MQLNPQHRWRRALAALLAADRAQQCRRLDRRDQSHGERREHKTSPSKLALRHWAHRHTVDDPSPGPGTC
jgi:hypothetical protein